MIFYTYEEVYANFNNMWDDQYNKSECSIELNVPGFTGAIFTACQKDMETGIITIIQRPQDYQRVKPHIPYKKNGLPSKPEKKTKSKIK